MTTLHLSGGLTVDSDDLEMLGSKILVQALPASEVGEQTAGGVWLPQSAAQDHQRVMQGIVLATGPDVTAYVPVGARVICERFAKVALDEAGDIWVSWEDAVQAVLSG